MKALWWIVALVVVVAGFVWWKGSSSMGSIEKSSSQTAPTSDVVAKNSVEIKNFVYTPATLTVKVGEAVVWKNSDAAGHSATADDGSFDTGVLSQGESSDPVTFAKAGTYAYHCTPHPNIKGTIVVTE